MAIADSPWFSSNLLMILFRAGALTLHFWSAKHDLPSSAALQSWGSKGTLPKKGTPISLHILMAPPLLLSKTSVEATNSSNSGAFSFRYSMAHWVMSLSSPVSVIFMNLRSVICWHSPLMFSTTPRTGRPSFLQKLTSLRTSMRETCWGVVIMIAPSIPLTCIIRTTMSQIKRLNHYRIAMFMSTSSSIYWAHLPWKKLGNLSFLSIFSRGKMKNNENT